MLAKLCHWQCWTQSIFGDTIYCKLRLGTCKAPPPPPPPWWGLRGWNFLILITLDCLKRCFWEKNHIKLFIYYIYLLKLLLKNVEEIFGQIFLGAHSTETVSKHVWVCHCLTVFQFENYLFKGSSKNTLR